MRLFIATILTLVTALATAQTLAFPGATGFGKFTRGAYAKYAASGDTADLPRILYVDNLNDAGTGSLRAALKATMPRIVVFRTGGTITLTSFISITSPFLTVAGYTAPGDGILIRGATIWVREKEVIFRNIRVRPGVSNIAMDGINISAWVSTGKNKITNVIIDHCSVSWTFDGAIDVNGKNGGVENVTIQNCIVAEGFAGHSLLTNSGSGCRSLSNHRNFYANGEGRMPIRYGNEPITSTTINNVTYNFKSEGLRYNSMNRGDALYNYFKNGPNHPTNNKAIVVGYNEARYPGEENKPSIYLLGNQRNGTAVTPHQSNKGSLMKMATSPYYNNTVYGFTPETNMQALVTSVLSSAGAFPRDAVDMRLVSNYYNNTGSIPTSTTVLDYPTLAAGTYPVHNNGVHLAWLVENGYAANTTAAASLTLSYLINPTNGSGGYSIYEQFINDTAYFTNSSENPEPPAVPKKKG